MDMRIILLAVGVSALPLASSWAASGSNVAPDTVKSAAAGATAGHKDSNSNSPTSGTGGGGMATAIGVKAGGMDKQNKITQTGASQ